MIKISIIDDEQLFLEGLKLLFSNENKVEVVLAENNANDFIEKLEQTKPSFFPDIALVDIQMKPINGFELVAILKEKYPELKLIILSSHYKKNVIGHMIKLGVSAFIPKNANKTLLMEAIEAVYEFGVYFTKKDKDLVQDHLNFRTKKPSIITKDQLSKREIEVLELICTEKTNHEIAENLFLSKRTVENHRQRILEKVGAKNTVGLVVYAIVNDIHPLPPSF
ncbi:response regulator transcription factor [Aureivirga sp. CE67]|uniref:response regulator transcription factor n=1 Tax=Aureivirga sp. CE67 TaxID=1788983 RepID=UPI0018C9C805|nr:response regulator transcription factor [Aureivirga sp. CE67]